MNILVIGQGGREHAIIKKLAESPQVNALHAIPGNAGMLEARCWPDLHPLNSDIPQFCRDQNIGLVVIGPEVELMDGLSDRLREQGILCFGPSKKAAQLEGDKGFSKNFMHEYGIPCGKSIEVSSTPETLDRAPAFQAPYVLKACGLCAGKGVFICQNLDELEVAANSLFQDKLFGASGERALLEEYLDGEEISYFVLTNGEASVSLPVFRDHKRLLDGDRGPNTGGMGVAGPLSLSPEILQNIEKNIVSPSLRGLQSRQMEYRGIVFIGIMLTPDGPKVLEYNVRFGDPEAQCLMGLLASDPLDLFLSVAKGFVPKLKWKDEKITCVVLAADGYPENPRKGDAIKGDFHSFVDASYGLAAGVKKVDDIYLTNGGRVLNILGFGPTATESQKCAYNRVKKIQWAGQQYRKDIGHSLL